MDDRESTRDRRPCLMLHGLGGGPYELQPLIDAVEASGREVRAPVLPGHEGPGPRMPASSWRDWTSSAEAWYDDMASADAPAAVVGFSTGAMIALHLASRRKVDRLVLLAPFLAIRHTGRLPFHPAGLLRIVARWAPDIPRRGAAVRDPEMRRWASAHDRFRTFNLHATLSALELIEEVKPRLSTIEAPVLIIQGLLDSIVEPSGSAWLHERLKPVRSRLIELPRSDHLVALDRERGSMIEAVLGFLDEATAG